MIQLAFRIMKVDLNFPPVPEVSSDAKNLICQVKMQLYLLNFIIPVSRKIWEIFIFQAFQNWFILQLLVKDSSKRLTLQKIMEHPWIIKNANPKGICS